MCIIRVLFMVLLSLLAGCAAETPSTYSSEKVNRAFPQSTGSSKNSDSSSIQVKKGTEPIDHSNSGRSIPRAQTGHLSDVNETEDGRIAMCSRDRNGVDSRHYEDGPLLYEVRCKDGKAQGIMKRYYENGELQAEIPYSRGNIAGAVKNYYKSGALQYEVLYTDNKREGVLKSYYENGTIRAVAPYNNNRLDGLVKNYYENGKLKSELSYKNGKIEGKAIYYSETGTITATATYRNGKLIKMQKEQVQNLKK